jgi:L-threonylcarbamoyladenylate synthase
MPSLLLLQRLITQRRGFLSSIMKFSTRVLNCEPTSISFPPGTTIPTISSPTSENALKSAAEQLKARHCVAFPTETVYGLGALALDENAASKIFATKGRPPDNPLIVHVSSHEMMRPLLPNDYQIPRIYTILMKRFWPGPLTLLFPCNPKMVPTLVTAKHPTVAIRMPSHPVARALIALTNAPIAAPSANTSGKPSPTRAEHVLRDMDGKLEVILDGGPCGFGLESTVVDGLHPDGNIRILRPGGVTVEQIEQVMKDEYPHEVTSRPKVLVHRRDYSDEAMENAPTTPGMKYRHYSPSVPVVLLMTSSCPPHHASTSTFQSLVNTLKVDYVSPHAKLKIGLLTPSDSPLSRGTLDPAIEWTRFPLGAVADPAMTAHRLFDGLLTLEKQGVQVILIEEISEDNEGLAVMNRVKKAAGETVWLSDV